MVQLAATAKALDAAYWRKLVPGLSIGEPLSSLGPIAPPEGIAKAAAGVRAAGWFQLTDAVPAERVVTLRRAIEKITAAGWLPSFGFVYDQFWQLLRLPAIDRLAEELLGPDYELRLNPWINQVGRDGNQAGWAPHADGEAGSSGESPGRFSFLGVWLALAHATLDNGCMYLLPAEASRDYLSWLRGEERTREETIQLAGRSLHRARAVPAPAGDALGWHGEIIHWGTPASDFAGEPRLSVAIEYQSAAAPWDRWPHRNASERPPEFEDRLRMIARTALKFASGPFRPIYTSSAQQILDALGRD